MGGDAFASLTELLWRLHNSVDDIEWKPKNKGFAESLKTDVFCHRQLGEDEKKGLRRNLKCVFVWITIPAEFGAIFDRTL